MRRFMMHLVTEVDFEDGDEASDKAVQNYQKDRKNTVVIAARRTLAPNSQGLTGRKRLGRRNQE